eukprot:scaffold1875_cov253-Pinguiococcus_pyrenoidosus.AAC.28
MEYLRPPRFSPSVFPDASRRFAPPREWWRDFSDCSRVVFERHATAVSSHGDGKRSQQSQPQARIQPAGLDAPHAEREGPHGAGRQGSFAAFKSRRRQPR